MILVALLLDSLSTAQQQQVYFPTLNKDPITKIVTIVTLVEKHQCPYFWSMFFFLQNCTEKLST